jgi:hypothetical protein
MITLLPGMKSNGPHAIAYVSALLGRPNEVRRAVTAHLASFVARGEALGELIVLTMEGYTLLLPYQLDDREVRRRYGRDVARATLQVEEVLDAPPPQLNHCPLLVAHGQWAEARTLWMQRGDVAVTNDVAWNLPHVGAMARAQAEADEAWALVREGVPDGLQTEPGTTHFTVLDLQCLAARLALDGGAHVLARQWLEAHDRWLMWAGDEVCWGRADGQLGWAEYYRALGEPVTAL